MREDAAGEVDRFPAVGRFAGQLQVIFGGDQGGEAASDGGLIVGDEDASQGAAR